MSVRPMAVPFDSGSGTPEAAMALNGAFHVGYTAASLPLRVDKSGDMLEHRVTG